MWFVIPGALDQVTGGYLFDRRIVEGLRAQGRAVEVIELPGRFPDADDAARHAMAAALARLPDGAAVAIDGLALASLRDALARETARLRLVAFVHHPLALETGLSPHAAAACAALERDLLPRFRGALCPSPRTASELAAYGVARVEITPPGVAKPAAIPARPARGTVRLLCVATLTPRKGHLVLIDALEELAALDWSLTCVGSLGRDLETVAAVEARILRAGLGGRVALVGEWPPERLGEAYAAADVFVLPSFHEGYGMAFAEAMAWGLPIVATRAGAIPDTVPDTVAGILVPPGDPGALAAALFHLITDAPLRRRYAAGAAARAATLPDWHAAAAAWAAAFDRLVA